MRVLFFTDPLGVPNGVPSLGNFQQKKREEPFGTYPFLSRLIKKLFLN
jgi:hypothetical protein